MKQNLLILFLLMLPLSLSAGNEQDNIRVTKLFNFNWKFQAGEQDNAQAVHYDDSRWRSLDLPHDFQIEQPWDKSAGGGRGYKAMGAGWYRKTFSADPAWKGKKVLLDFEGVMLNGEVWLNGKKMVSMDYGYLGYEADMTKLPDCVPK